MHCFITRGILENQVWMKKYGANGPVWTKDEKEAQPLTEETANALAQFIARNETPYATIYVRETNRVIRRTFLSASKV